MVRMCVVSCCLCIPTAGVSDMRNAYYRTSAGQLYAVTHINATAGAPNTPPTLNNAHTQTRIRRREAQDSTSLRGFDVTNISPQRSPRKGGPFILFARLRICVRGIFRYMCVYFFYFRVYRACYMKLNTTAIYCLSGLPRWGEVFGTYPFPSTHIHIHPRRHTHTHRPPSSPLSPPGEVPRAPEVCV